MTTRDVILLAASTLLGLFVGARYLGHPAAGPSIENNATQTVQVGERTAAERLEALANANGRDWLTVAEYARELGIDRDTVYARIQRGEIEAEKDGQAWRIPLARNLQETGK